MRSRSLWFPLGVLSVAGALGAQSASSAKVSFPEAAPGPAAKAFFRAFNDGGEKALRSYITAHRSKAALERRPLGDRLAQLQQICTMLKSLQPHRVESEKAGALTVLARAGQGLAWVELTFGVGAEGKLGSFKLVPAEAPDAPAVDYTNWRTLRDLVRAVRVAQKIPGIAVVVDTGVDGAPLKGAAAGVRVQGESDRVAVEDRFHIGSVTKSMTATLIGILVEQGKLGWQDTLSELLPDEKMHEDCRGITVEQLLQHRAGLKGYLTTDDSLEARLVKIEDPMAQRRAFVRHVLAESPVTEPGRAFRYSNAGYSVLGYIVECRGGSSFEVLAKQWLFAPMQMKHTGFGIPELAGAGQPKGHFGSSGSFRVQKRNEDLLMPYIRPAGDVHAAMADLVRFGRMHLDGMGGKDGLLRAATIRRLHKPMAPSGGSGYAAGWMIEGGARPKHHHAGSAGAFVAFLVLDPTRNTVVALAMNCGGLTNQKVAMDLAEAVSARYTVKK